MNRVPKPAAGYTILETLIFLAVTSMLLISVMGLVSGQQRKTEFNQGIREVEARLRDVINDVSTGFYEKNTGFTCSATTAGRPTFTATEAGQGQNAGCLFIGRVVQFVTEGDANKYTAYNVAGRQKTGTAPERDIQSFSEAIPTAIAPSSSVPSVPDTSSTSLLPFGITLEKMCYTTLTCASPESTAFGIFSGFGSSSGGNLLSGSVGFNLAVIPNTTPSKSKLEMAEAINGINDTTPLNPNNGVILCFKSGGTDQYGKITIGGNNRQDTLTLEILEGTCS